MNQNQPDLDSVKFEKLHLKNYGVFQGEHDFVFNEKRTIIVGDHGTGKTTLMNALANSGPAAGVERSVGADSPGMDVMVSTRGNRELIREFRNLIFITMEDCSRKLEVLQADIIDYYCIEEIVDEIHNIFSILLQHKPYKLELHQDLDPVSMAMGESACLYLASLFAFRNRLNLDLPLVLDDPFGCLDIELQGGLCTFIKDLECQQILLLSQYVLERELDRVDYVLGP